MATTTKLKLHTMLGNYPITKALKSGEIKSDLIDFDFAEVKVANNLFKKVVREAAYDVAELAIVTYLQAKSYGKPYVLIPAVIVLSLIPIGIEFLRHRHRAHAAA